MKKLILSAILFYSIPSLIIAQNNVGIGTTSPNANALLELDNNGSPRGFLLPRQDISTFTLAAIDQGMMVFNSVDNKLYVWDGSQWITATSEWVLNGSDLYNANSGNVGVGTNNPLSKLSVAGNMSVGNTFAGTATAPANSLIVEGRLGIGTTVVNGDLQFASVLTNRKVVLYESSNNDHQYYGFGVNNSVLRYQVSGNFADHVFYAAASSSTSTELMRLNGTGLLELPSSLEASSSAGTGVLEIGGSLRLDGNEIITNDGSSLFINTGSTGNVQISSDFFYNASNSRIGHGSSLPDAKFEVVGDILARNGVFTVSTNNADISGATNIDHLWHDDSPNEWHMVSDGTYKITGNSTLNVGNMDINNESDASCFLSSTIPFNIYACNEVTTSMDFDFNGSYTGILTGSLPDFRILVTADGSQFLTPGSANPFGSFQFQMNNTTMIELDNNRIFPGTDNSGTCGTSSRRWNTVYASNGTINTSDRRQKTNIEELHYGLGEVMQLKPVSFNWKKGNDDKKLGLIAQDIQNVIPEVVSVGDDEDKTLGVYYSDLIPVLINAIQEQQEQIQNLEDRISKYEAMN